MGADARLFHGVLVKFLPRGGAQAGERAVFIAHGADVHIALRIQGEDARGAVVKGAHPHAAVEKPTVERAQPVGGIGGKVACGDAAILGVGVHRRVHGGDEFGMGHFAIGGGRGRPALRRGGEGRQGDGDGQQGQKQGGNGYLSGVHDGTDPFFQRVAAEGVGERQNSRARFLHAQKRGGIGAAFFLPAAAQHARVAAEFDIAAREDRHGPHEGVEPVQADGHGDEQLPDGVEMADVGKFMVQRAQKRLRVGLAGALGQEDDRAQNAAGHRGVDARAQAHLQRAAQGVLVSAMRG